MVKRVVTFFFVILIIVSCIFVFTSKIPRGRLGVVIPGDPTMIISFESDRPRFAVFLLPAKLQIDALNGYGWYDLAALWKLDAMDNRNGELYRKSIEESFAAPIQWHSVSSKTLSSFDSDAVIGMVKQTFSLSTMIHMLVTRTTNIRPGELIAIWKKFQMIGGDNTTLFDFRLGQIAGEVPLPDQTTVWQFDSEKYDAIVGNNLEDTPLRQEGMRIALYNTTGTPGIAQRIARTIEHVGGFVVSVGNDDVPYDGMCEVSAEKQFLSSFTADFFHSLYGCTLIETKDSARADLVVRLGKGIEARYLPKK